MYKLKQAFSDEVKRISKKEIKSSCSSISEQCTILKKRVAELEKKVKSLEKMFSVPMQGIKTNGESSVKTEQKPEEKKLRITAQRIKTLREKLSFSQAQFATILGVNIQSVNHWENGKTIPRDVQKLRIAELRDMGKRELTKLMQEKNIPVKKESRKTKKTMSPAPKVSSDKKNS